MYAPISTSLKSVVGSVNWLQTCINTELVDAVACVAALRLHHEGSTNIHMYVFIRMHPWCQKLGRLYIDDDDGGGNHASRYFKGASNALQTHRKRNSNASQTDLKNN